MPRHNLWLGIALGWFVMAGAALAQPELPKSTPLLKPPPSPVPALITTAGQGETDASAKPETKPPAVIESITFDDQPAPATTDDSCCFYIGADRTEYLLWWMKSGPLPPLATRSRTGAPALSNPDTRVIAGGEPANYDAFSGGRFTIGSRLNDSNVGTEFTYFFLGTRTTAIGSGPIDGTIGRPIINAATGAETVLPVSGATVRDGVFSASSSARAQGAEANVVINLFHDDCSTITALVGYRFLQIQEGLFVGQVGDLMALGGAVPFTLGDQFDTSNRFNGGQIGLRADGRKGPVFVEVAAKIAFGDMTEVVRVSGMTGFAPGVPTAGGVLALPSNAGRLTRDAFAVVPEATFKFGFGDEHQRVFVGYDFTYLSDVVRPGDQIDRVVNVGQVPLLGGSEAFTGPDRPRLAIKSTDMWLQGLMIGFETKW
jgi:hypothetical protein